MNRSLLKSKAFIGFVIALLVLASGFIFLQMQSAHGQHKMHGHGDARHEHNEVTMPGLKGENASEQESAELAVMFRRFEEITRTVENLPNGIRTVTFAEDEALMETVASHVIGMIDRVDEGDDPKVIIQSPTLDIIFERRASISTDMDWTDQGIVVIQTSDDPEVVAALQRHAAEVTAMVDRGMQAVHEMMSARHNERG